MFIVTKKFSLTPASYFQLLLLRFFNKRWWLLVIILAFTIIDISANHVPGFPTFFAVIYPLLVLFRFYRHAYSDLNRNLYLTRELTITDEGITIRSDEEGNGYIKRQLIIRIEEVGNYLMVYLTKTSFLGIPKSAFENEEDYKMFLMMYKDLL